VPVRGIYFHKHRGTNTICVLSAAIIFTKLAWQHKIPACSANLKISNAAEEYKSFHTKPRFFWGN